MSSRRTNAHPMSVSPRLKTADINSLWQRRGPLFAGRIGAALVAMAAWWMAAGCGHTADFLDAALMSPVLVENFEAPAVEQASGYLTGQSLQTGANRWDVAAGSVELVNKTGQPDMAVSDGNQAVHLTGSMATTVPTTRKKQYTLTFHYARHNRLGTEASRARVEVQGAGPTLLEAEISHEGEAFDSYRRYTGTFTADSPRTTIRFTSLTPGLYGITLDGISVRSVPPPLPAPPPRPQ